MNPRLTLILLLSAVVAGTGPALAQIVREKPAKVKAANRRALREAKQSDAPYKDTHLDVSKQRLKRGRSEQPPLEGSDELKYKTGKAPNVKEPGILGLRRKKKL